MRNPLLEVMGQNYIRTTRAKGLSEFSTTTSRALRNAPIPVITALGSIIANLMIGSFVAEKIFAIPDLGAHFINSVSQRGYTTIMSITISYATFLMVMAMAAGVFHYLINP